MTKILIFGNSGAGKTTLAKKIYEAKAAAHLDLDTIAWASELPPKRKLLAESKRLIDEFITINPEWVIEGCYSDLLRFAAHHADDMIFLDLPISTCIDNARRRPWEPHKYKSKQAQDENLSMLIDWIRDYENRNDTFSRVAHQALFDDFKGSKKRVVKND